MVVEEGGFSRDVWTQIIRPVTLRASVQLDHRPAETAPDTSQSVKRLEEREQQLRETVEDACRVNELLERLFQCMQSADRESAALAREEQEFVELRDHHQDAIRELRQGLSQAQALLSQGAEGVQRPDFLSEQELALCVRQVDQENLDLRREISRLEGTLELMQHRQRYQHAESLQQQQQQQQQQHQQRQRLHPQAVCSPGSAKSRKSRPVAADVASTGRLPVAERSFEEVVESFRRRAERFQRLERDRQSLTRALRGTSGELEEEDTETEGQQDVDAWRELVE